MIEEYEANTNYWVTAEVIRNTAQGGYYDGCTSYHLKDLTVWVEVMGTEIDITEAVKTPQKDKLRTEFIEFLVKKDRNNDEVAS